MSRTRALKSRQSMAALRTGVTLMLFALHAGIEGERDSSSHVFATQKKQGSNHFLDAGLNVSPAFELIDLPSKFHRIWIEVAHEHLQVFVPRDLGRFCWIEVVAKFRDAGMTKIVNSCGQDVGVVLANCDIRTCPVPSLCNRIWPGSFAAT